MIAAMLLAGAGEARAEETRVVVRVLSKGAKFVGTSMGGARVLVRDDVTGELLAEGVTRGGTGDTERIMRAEMPHHAAVATDQAASFTATLDLEAPRRIRVEAHGPLGLPESMGGVSSTQWVVPGKHIEQGDAWLLTLPGLAVDLVEPRISSGHAADRPLTVRAHVAMMCGCPLTPGGLWDADAFEVKVRVQREGELVVERALEYAGTASRFEANLEGLKPGTYEALVYAYQPANGNTGVDRTTFTIR